MFQILFWQMIKIDKKLDKNWLYLQSCLYNSLIFFTFINGKNVFIILYDLPKSQLKFTTLPQDLFYGTFPFPSLNSCPCPNFSQFSFPSNKQWTFIILRQNPNPQPQFPLAKHTLRVLRVVEICCYVES